MCLNAVFYIKDNKRQNMEIKVKYCPILILNPAEVLKLKLLFSV